MSSPIVIIITFFLFSSSKERCFFLFFEARCYFGFLAAIQRVFSHKWCLEIFFAMIFEPVMWFLSVFAGGLRLAEFIAKQFWSEVSQKDDFWNPGGNVTFCGTSWHCDIFNLCMGRRTKKILKQTSNGFWRSFKKEETFCTSLLPTCPHKFFETFFAWTACLIFRLLSVFYYTSCRGQKFKHLLKNINSV